jgi:hypothetical protein
MDEQDADGPVAESSGGTPPSNKVARLVEEYELGSVAAEMERSWTATGDRHRSLRDLAGYFNQRLLERRLTASGVQPLEDQVETLYPLLRGDESEGDRVRARRRLERAGIDAEALLDEFVSYQTVRRYLEDHRGATYTREESDQVEAVRETLQRLRGRVQAVATGKFERLRESSRLSVGEFQLTVDIRVYCEECERQYQASALLERGGCECG